MVRMRYRHKVRLRKLGRFLLLALGALALVGILVLVYADSLITYDRGGAHLATESGEMLQEEAGKPLPVISDPVIEIQEETVAAIDIADTGGIYISAQMLKNVDKVTELIQQREEPCAVMIDLKSDFGSFYYTSKYAKGNYADGIDVKKVDALLRTLEEQGYYMVASIPAFPDRAYVLEHDDLCIRVPGGYGWMDSRGIYWLDPSKDEVLSYLMELVRDLVDKGFREVCFTSFQFPKEGNYVYDSDLSRSDVLWEAAREITKHFAKTDIVVSFRTAGTEFPSAGGRIYVFDIESSQIDPFATAYGNSDAVRELVFVVNSKDARFERFAVMRPLMTESSHEE